MKDLKLCYGVDEAAALLSVSPQTLYRMTTAGEIKRARKFGKVLYSLSEICRVAGIPDEAAQRIIKDVLKGEQDEH